MMGSSVSIFIMIAQMYTFERIDRRKYGSDLEPEEGSWGRNPGRKGEETCSRRTGLFGKLCCAGIIALLKSNLRKIIMEKRISIHE